MITITNPINLYGVGSLAGINFKEMPKWFFGQVVFGRPGAPRPKNHTVSRSECLVGLAAFGGKAKKQLVS